jgi:hypothetical protein
LIERDDLRRDPLQVRKAMAKSGPGIRFNEHIKGDGPMKNPNALAVKREANQGRNSLERWTDHHLEAEIKFAHLLQNKRIPRFGRCVSYQSFQAAVVLGNFPYLVIRLHIWFRQQIAFKRRHNVSPAVPDFVAISRGPGSDFCLV